VLEDHPPGVGFTASAGGSISSKTVP